MSDFSYLNERLAVSQINERVAAKQRSAVTGRSRRRPGRHALAGSLHRFANRLDS